MAGRAKHAARSHVTHHRTEYITRFFYYNNTVKANMKKAGKERASVVEKIMGMIKKGDR